MILPMDDDEVNELVNRLLEVMIAVIISVVVVVMPFVFSILYIGLHTREAVQCLPTFAKTTGSHIILY